ncbi:BLOC-1-related complex subunit 6 isoform X2 [Anguilla anguilla]|uniref:BLOC-1-related complex subunit 6 isoform X2 n=1 Tax=Anguilla anguilla TaxID=7936 RepID=UPI0015AF94FD|nr:BLOC-1-related complex subunit 6 isoform X2 [Anguilla anguilla]
MSHSPGIGAHVQGAANGVATLESPKLCGEEVSLVNDLPTLQPLKHGEIVPCRAPKLAVGSPVEEVNCEGQPEEERDTDTSHTCTSDMPCLDTPQSDAYSEEPHIKEPHIEEHHSELICTDVPQTTADGVLGSSLPDGARRVEEEEEEVVEEEEDEEVQQQQQREVEEQNEGQDDTEDSPELSADSPTVSEPPTESQVHPKDPLPSEEQEACRSPPRCQEPPCPPHVMAQVHVRNAPERERIVRGMQDTDYSVRSRGSLRRPVDIPPIDPSVLLDLQRHTQDVAQSVELMMRSLNGTIQNMTALSVGYIQTYRDSVDSLGEAVDMSIKGMYTLMARCEELDRSMQPIHALAQQIRDIKRTLDALETLCK